MNPLLFPPALIKRALDDLAALADAVRRLPEIQEEVRDTVEHLQGELFGRLDRFYRLVEPLPGMIARMSEQMDALREEMEPIQQLPVVRETVQELSGKLDGLRGQLDALREDISPIQQLTEVRKGIEPLDDDMREVRLAVDELEPIVKQMNARLAALDQRLEAMRADLSLVGEVADKIPGVGR